MSACARVFVRYQERAKPEMYVLTHGDVCTHVSMQIAAHACRFSCTSAAFTLGRQWVTAYAPVRVSA
eukprot:33130-Eustigmatos_ZCMA.PRE.1